MISSNTSDRFFEYYLMSTDTKPVNSYIGNGSACVVMDTLDVYFYDEDKYKAGQDPWIKAE